MTSHPVRLTSVFHSCPSEPEEHPNGDAASVAPNPGARWHVERMPGTDGAGRVGSWQRGEELKRPGKDGRPERTAGKAETLGASGKATLLRA